MRELCRFRMHNALIIRVCLIESTRPPLAFCRVVLALPSFPSCGIAARLGSEVAAAVASASLCWTAARVCARASVICLWIACVRRPREIRSCRSSGAHRRRPSWPASARRACSSGSSTPPAARSPRSRASSTCARAPLLRCSPSLPSVPYAFACSSVLLWNYSTSTSTCFTSTAAL